MMKYIYKVRTGFVKVCCIPLFLTALFFLNTCTAIAAEDTDTSVSSCGYIPMEWDNSVPELDSNISYREGIEAVDGDHDEDGGEPRLRSSYEISGSLPSAYPASHTEEDKIKAYLKENCTPTRSQNPYGTCWAHATVALGEMYGIAKGERDKNVDYSELHIIDNCFRQVENPVVGDEEQLGSVSFTGGNLLNHGGNIYYSAQVLSKGIGFVDEATLPYNDGNCNAVNNGTLSTEPFGDDIAHLKYAFRLNIKMNPELVKQAIRENGIAGISYYDNSGYFNNTYNSYYCSNGIAPSHAVCVVGWDDDFPSSYFNSDPGGNGAWLIRNSWSVSDEAEFGHSTYFWLSYNDLSLAEAAYVFELSPGADEYDNNYYYDTQFHLNSSLSVSGKMKSANIYTVKGLNKNTEKLEEVQVLTDDNTADKAYKLEIYSDLDDETDPESGTLIASKDGKFTFPGIYTITLDDGIILEKGSLFSVIITMDGDSVAMEYPFEDGGGLSVKTGIKPGQSFFFYTDSGKWEDISDVYQNGEIGNFCISAHTKDSDDLWSGDFTFTPPASLTYDGKPHAAEVRSSGKDVGDITVYYAEESSSAWSTDAPSDAGNYKVKIDVSGGSSHGAQKDISGSDWVFTVSKAEQSGVSLSGPEKVSILDGEFRVEAGGGEAGEYVFSSNDTSVLEVDDSGAVTPKGQGTATISVYREESLNYLRSNTDSLTIEVYDGSGKGEEEKKEEEKSEEIRLKLADGSEFVLLHDTEYNTYKTTDGKDVIVIGSISGNSAGTPVYQYTGKKIVPGKNGYVFYNGALYIYGTDYKLSFKKNKNRGSAVLTVKWLKGSVPYADGERKTKLSFNIIERTVSENMISLDVRKDKIKKITVNDGELSIKAKKKDYSYSGNAAEGFNIIFRNNFKGTVFKKLN
ncbi:MAG: hypothetical protein IJU87_07355 [Lachnospiraceae bacterium]|nr:hypothetical protein [Lachnospiraceae bacterium]